MRYFKHTLARRPIPINNPVYLLSSSYSRYNYNNPKKFWCKSYPQQTNAKSTWYIITGIKTYPANPSLSLPCYPYLAIYYDNNSRKVNITSSKLLTFSKIFNNRLHLVLLSGLHRKITEFLFFRKLLLDLIMTSTKSIGFKIYPSVTSKITLKHFNLFSTNSLKRL